MSQTLFLLYRPEPARPMSQAGTGGYGIRPYVFCRGGEGRVFPCCVCRGDHWSPANLPPQRIFRDSFLARQTGTGEQCSPLQAFFGSSAEGSRPLPTGQKEKSAAKEPCPGQINPALAHKRQSCGPGAWRRTTSAASLQANSLVRLFAPQGQTLFAPRSQPRNARPLRLCMP